MLAQCDPGERAVGVDYRVAGGPGDVRVRSSRRVSVSDDVSGWAVTFVNGTSATQFVTATAVCETV